MHLGDAVSSGGFVRMMSWVIQCCRGSNYLALYIYLKVALARSRKKSSRTPVFSHDPCSSLDPSSSVASCTSLRAIPSNNIDSPRIIIVRTSCAKFPVLGEGSAQPPSFHSRLRTPIFHHIEQLRAYVGQITLLQPVAMSLISAGMLPMYPHFRPP